MIKYCKNCASLSKTQDGRDACARFKILINPNEDFCSQHVTKGQTEVCDICKVHLPTNQLINWLSNDLSKSYWVCNNCLNSMNTCATCKRGNICGFKSDRSEPQMIMRTTSNGMMRMQTQVKNPHLVMKHCQKCACSDGADPSIRDICCFKDENGANCKRWEIKS